MSLTINSSYELPGLFWGTTITPHAPIYPTEAEEINATPARVLVWPGANAGDNYNPFNGTEFNPKYGSWNATKTNESDFAALCRAIGCTPIFQLPAENNNSSLAAEIVNTTVKTLGFPNDSYFEFGNEPGLWTHWNIPWTGWHRRDNSTINATEYAQEVWEYIRVIHNPSVDPAARIIGLPGYGKGQSKVPGTGLESWITDTVEKNGDNLSAIAIHVYPANQKKNYTTFQTFYQSLEGEASIPIRASEVGNWTSQACALAQPVPCNPKNIPVFITEIGSALSHSTAGKFADTFPGALDMAAQMVQGMEYSYIVSNLDVYAAFLDTSNSWFPENGSAARPDYVAYTDVLSHLGPVASNVSVTPVSSPPGFNETGFKQSIFAIATQNPKADHRVDLMLVNTNLSWNLTVAPDLSKLGIAPGTPVEVWTWVNNTTAAPVPRFYGDGLSQPLLLPPQSLMLVEAYPVPSAPLTFTETGLAHGTRWFLNVSGTTHTSVGTNITVFLPYGDYPVNATALPVSNQERLAGFPPAQVSIPEPGNTASVPFVYQWKLTLEAIPEGAGSIVPSPSWANASQPLVVTAEPSTGFGFYRWYGWGPGSFSGTSPVATLVPTGAVIEHAAFRGGGAVTFAETGLRPGTAWSVIIRGHQFNSSRDGQITLAEPNGTYGYHVDQVPGYHSVPVNSAFTVSGTSVTVNVTFYHPQPPPFPVTFVESGLPSGTSWSVEIRGQQFNSASSGQILLNESNGTYGYHVVQLHGYHSVPINSSFTVNGTSVTVHVTFYHPPPPSFPVTFVETGLPPGTVWTVIVRGQEFSSSTDGQIALSESNGTYGYHVNLVPGYHPVPVNSSFHVAGTAVTVNVVFYHGPPPTHPVVFEQRGLPPGTPWSVTIRGKIYTSGSDGTIDLAESNGTYGYHVNSVVGFHPVPVNSSFRVNGAVVVVEITFYHHPPPFFSVTFVETGLPQGSVWTITVRGQTVSSDDEMISFSEINGTYGFHVGTATGYHPVPVNSSFHVSGTPLTVTVEFYHAPPPTYAVTFMETGLPSGTAWHVLLRNGEFGSNRTTVSVSEADGHYGFNVSVPMGYRAVYPRSGFNVTGAPVAIAITYLPRQSGWQVHFVETGLWSGRQWEVDVNGSWVHSVTSWITVNLTNGSYLFLVAGSGAVPKPTSGSVLVAGPDLTLFVGDAPRGVSVNVITIVFTLGPFPPFSVLALEAGSVAAVIGVAVWGTVVLIRKGRGEKDPPNLES